MPYSVYTVHNHQTHETELFHVRISDDGFAEWLGSREALATAGYPDRPPDVDTPTMRVWVPHAGEEHHPYFEDQPQHLRVFADATHYPVYVAKWDSPELTVRLALEMADGRWQIVMVGDGPKAQSLRWPAWVEPHEAHFEGTRVALARTSDRRVWASIEDALATVDGMHPWPAAQPEITTYLDLLAIDAEIELAEADAARGFLSPLPEGRA